MPSIVYKEWLPDQPELGNIGLIRALNVLPIEGGYSPFLPLDTSLGTLGATGTDLSGFMATGATKGARYVFAFANGTYYESTSGSATFTARGTNTQSSRQSFAQYEDLVIATSEDNFPKFKTLGSASNFQVLTNTETAPPANLVAVIGQFVVLGDLENAQNSVRWSSIDQPRSWPAPGSATAIASQAGQQDLKLAFGQVNAIHGGDQFGIILQAHCVTRMSYIGPPAVFEFDEISVEQGSIFQHGSCEFNGWVYFVSSKGVCRTNGVGVENIGAGKVDKYIAGSNRVRCAVDSKAGLVYFAYANSGFAGAGTDHILVYNPLTNGFTEASQNLLEMVTTRAPLGALPTPIWGFSSAGASCILGSFQATAGSAILENGEAELTEAGRTYIDGIKPHVESSGTAPAIGIRIGTRNDLNTTPSYTSTAGPNSRTGFANFRAATGVTEAKYHRVEVNITGNFKKASGFEMDAKPTGSA